ncbi:hypothetical protein COS74_01160 [bacterium CG06_land_8_20_14_3_00_33_50]|nr:MAG: hypothetical protein AUJ93_04490 [bacterium CG2_30_33_46]PIR67993.1 MAG: hypothetical protein COU50_00270 [bacterium CG10_big_fil_rev_8_21_14_0_10_33_18]PIU76972.1 MAG: hypothetical protein COS74_01160 [bacterium CG06_land_8_20_14_3_00_33_50]PIW81436.1 MAG: hypothetical protein COZ97_01705 [bacterium CG_4_8_14_3_um_filter_33_28]
MGWCIIINMPSKNSIKQYVENGIYHIYNRGINKQDIFLDDQDYSTFLFYLKLYLDNPDNLKDLDPQKKACFVRKNFNNSIDLLCYCLMPNHFHLILRQSSEKDIIDFMRCVATNYSMYFNKKYDRVGYLFQGRYKAVLVNSDNYLFHLSRYIHLNPSAIQSGKGASLAEEYKYSSYANYLGLKYTNWLKPELILEYFDQQKDQNIIAKSIYKEFIEDYEIDSKEILGDLVIE